MRESTMIAGSYPAIVTSGGNPRVNKDLIDNIFLRKYIAIFGELLQKKGDLEKLNIAYIGGYSNAENISRSKLYISAYNYYLNALGYSSLSKNNLTVLEANNIDENIEKIEQCDLLFLGIGTDQIFNDMLDSLEQKGVYLNELIAQKNILITSICSGSVMSAERIYGGTYDNFYYGKDVYNYPLRVDSLSLNPVTMEPDFYPNDASDEKTLEFIEKSLKPDSFKTAFFACKPNSLFLIAKDKIYSYGEIYLFMDGEYFQIENEFEKSDVTKLITMVQNYNEIKNRKNVFNQDLSENIKSFIESMSKEQITDSLEVQELDFIEAFSRSEFIKNRNYEVENNEWKTILKLKFDSLSSEENLNNFVNDIELRSRFEKTSSAILDKYNIKSFKEYKENVRALYLKKNLFSLIKKSYNDYNGYYSDFKQNLYSFLEEYLDVNDEVVYYVLDTCGSLFSNQQLKQLLTRIQMEDKKRPQAIIDTTKNKIEEFRKEIEYERD